MISDVIKRHVARRSERATSKVSLLRLDLRSRPMKGASNNQEADVARCGIDVAMKSSSICITDGRGVVLLERAVTTDEAGLRGVLGGRRRMHCVLEAGPLAEWLAGVVEGLGHQATAIDPRKAYGVIRTKKKTDRLDARNLAKMSRTGRWRLSLAGRYQSPFPVLYLVRCPMFNSSAFVPTVVRSSSMPSVHRLLALALFLALAVSRGDVQGMDPRCRDRTALGHFTCTINRPDVRHSLTPYPNVVFAPGDNVRIRASGCVQTGGVGKTWKRYVDPRPESEHLYHGLIRIPTATPGTGLTRIKDVLGQVMVVSGAGLPPSELILFLGYEDHEGDYGDNAYNDHDDGTEDQCKGVGD